MVSGERPTLFLSTLTKRITSDSNALKSFEVPGVLGVVGSLGVPGTLVELGMLIV